MADKKDPGNEVDRKDTPTLFGIKTHPPMFRPLTEEQKRLAREASEAVDGVLGARETYSCVQCRLNRNGGTPGRILKYRHNGVLVNVEIKAGECDQCAIARNRGYFERVEEAARLGILDTINDGWRVDWDLFDDTAKFSDKYEPDFYQRLISLLIDIKILIEDLQSGAHAIMWDWPGAGTVFIAPYRYGGYKSPLTNPLFFIHFKDAKEYAIKFCAGVPWSIVQFGKVIKKEEALK